MDSASIWRVELLIFLNRSCVIYKRTRRWLSGYFSCYHTHVYTNTHMYHTNINAYNWTHICTHIHVYLSNHVHTNTHKYICIYTHTHQNIHTLTHVHTTYGHRHMYIHTSTQGTHVEREMCWDIHKHSFSFWRKNENMLWSLASAEAEEKGDGVGAFYFQFCTAWMSNTVLTLFLNVHRGYFSSGLMGHFSFSSLYGSLLNKTKPPQPKNKMSWKPRPYYWQQTQ